jgi:hypothetical protein
MPRLEAVSQTAFTTVSYSDRRRFGRAGIERRYGSRVSQKTHHLLEERRVTGFLSIRKAPVTSGSREVVNFRWSRPHLQGPVQELKKDRERPHIIVYVSPSLSSEMSENMRDFLDFAATCMEGRFELTILE